MSNCKTGQKISCESRCIDPATVDVAFGRLNPAGIEWVAYTCKLSGAKESVLLIGDVLASEMMKSLPAVKDVAGMKILACLYTAELCECDVVTVTGVAEHEVVPILRNFADLGLVAHRKLQGMNYYRLVSDSARRSIKHAMDAL